MNDYLEIYPGKLLKPKDNERSDTPMIESLFPTPVYKNQDYTMSDKERNLIRHVCGFAKTNDGGNWTSTERYLFDAYDELKTFKDYCQTQLNHYAHEILKIHKKQQFYITQSWGNLNTPGTNHHAHIHLNSVISAVYFVTENSSPIVFERNLSSYLFPLCEFTTTEFNEFNSDSWKVDNTKDTLLLFPSSLKHRVPNNKTDIDRITISFNSFIKGTIGDTSKATELKL